MNKTACHWCMAESIKRATAAGTVRPIPGVRQLAVALRALRADIAAGGEYPDAEFRVSQKFKVSAEALRAAYDERPA